LVIITPTSLKIGTMRFGLTIDGDGIITRTIVGLIPIEEFGYVVKVRIEPNGPTKS